MSSKRCAEEFKVEAVKQVPKRGRRAKDVAERAGWSCPGSVDGLAVLKRLQ